MQDEAFDGFGAIVDAIMAQAEARLAVLNKRQRETCPAADLVIGLQCGGSDAFSGVTANPALGFAADLLVRAGATVMFSEVTEVRDAIQLLTRRGDQRRRRPRAGARDGLVRLLSRPRRRRPQRQHHAGQQEGRPRQYRGEIARLDRQVGHRARSPACSPPGEKARQKGMLFAATPASDFICGTLQLASGMTLQVFTTGRGTPYGLAAAPVIKVATRSELARRWKDLIDFDAGRIATGEMTIEETGMGIVPPDPRCGERADKTLVRPLGHPQRSHAVQSRAGDLSGIGSGRSAFASHNQ